MSDGRKRLQTISPFRLKAVATKEYFCPGVSRRVAQKLEKSLTKKK